VAGRGSHFLRYYHSPRWHQQRYNTYPPSAYFSNNYVLGNVAIFGGEYNYAALNLLERINSYNKTMAQSFNPRHNITNIINGIA
jgi:hypothetical protein